MTASSRGSRAAASIIRSSRHPHPLICSDCISHLTRSTPISRRSYGMAATALKTDDASPNSSLSHLETSPTPFYTTSAGILLSRPPLLTAPQSSFEKAFFFYQKRLNERLAMPFTRYFYFKKDTPADTDRKIKAKERNWADARELGGYKAYGKEAWHDELLSSEADAAGAVNSGKLGRMGIAEPKFVIDALVKDSRVRAVEGKDGAAVEVQEGDVTQEGDVVERPLGRFTESDRKNDVRRLDRQLTRTLYLLVKREKGGWRFPSGGLDGRENLHQAAERILVQSAGVNMNTWIVGRVPVGHYIHPPYVPPTASAIEASTSKSTSSSTSSSTRKPKPTSTSTEPKTHPGPQAGEKVFFLKGRIMAGQANIAENMYGISDYKWLYKEEVEKHVSARYWSYVKNMLADR